jgi:hypothetical protein
VDQDQRQPETNRSVSGFGKESGDQVKTDFLPVTNWRALSVEQQATIRAARDKDPEIKKSQRQKAVLDRRDQKIKNLQKKISALKRNANKEAEDDDGSDDDDAHAITGAGNAFSGREEKKQAKKRRKK